MNKILMETLHDACIWFVIVVVMVVTLIAMIGFFGTGYIVPGLMVAFVLIWEILLLNKWMMR